MKLYPRELVLKLCRKYKLDITIKPDGTIIGLTNHLKTLKVLLEAQ